MLGENLAGRDTDMRTFEHLSVLKGLAAIIRKGNAAMNSGSFGSRGGLVAAGTLKAVSNRLKKVDDAAKSTNTSLDEFVKRIKERKTKIGTFDKGVLIFKHNFCNKRNGKRKNKMIETRQNTIFQALKSFWLVYNKGINGRCALINMGRRLIEIKLIWKFKNIKENSALYIKNYSSP